MSSNQESNQSYDINQLKIPKVRHQTSNVAQATPRMLRNASNSANLSDEYNINPDYQIPQRTPSKRLPSEWMPTKATILLYEEEQHNKLRQLLVE
ncbi:hypothetical protein JL09_g5260 [Pichia kudriavzevii]|uniref:Uncharacterized protein n=1 Tax=Pichia kudriavzevii TaxID=4909 RepID=A0A099NSL8_PICKU|nr:hypothetical protein JL09_g5260 [Pichia kudriavzevii]